MKTKRKKGGDGKSALVLARAPVRGRRPRTEAEKVQSGRANEEECGSSKIGRSPRAKLDKERRKEQKLRTVGGSINKKRAKQKRKIGREGLRSTTLMEKIEFERRVSRIRYLDLNQRRFG